MTKTEALQKLKEHGIELMCVTEMVYTFDQQDLAREDYDIPNDCVVPTKEQYNQIIDIIEEYGLYAIMEEYIVHDYMRLWSCSELSSSSAWYLNFNSGSSGQAHWNDNAKALGFSLAFWKFPNPRQKKIKHIEKTIHGLQKKLDELKSS